MKAVILHDVVGEDARSDERDVLVQVQVVSQALVSLGHEPAVVQFSLDLRGVVAELRRLQPDLVFNLVESVESRGSLIHLAPAVLEALGVPYTGSPTEAIFSTSSKVLAKRILTAAGIATPPWHTPASLRNASTLSSLPESRNPERAGPSSARRPGAPRSSRTGSDTGLLPGRYILKSVWEHASIGLDDTAVVETDDPGSLARMLAEREERLSGPVFAEQYIDGREFNISLLGDGVGSAEVLPHAEIHFVDYGADKLRIIGYAAKWDEQSFEYTHTPHRFDFPREDAPLLGRLSETARTCWDVFGLRGYARVDFRVDAAGRPWVLEVNANPCLSPDAGFAAAAQRAGLDFQRVVARILSDVPRRAAPACV